MPENDWGLYGVLVCEGCRLATDSTLGQTVHANAINQAVNRASVIGPLGVPERTSRTGASTPGTGTRRTARRYDFELLGS